MTADKNDRRIGASAGGSDLVLETNKTGDGKRKEAKIKGQRRKARFFRAPAQSRYGQHKRVLINRWEAVTVIVVVSTKTSIL